MPPKIVLGLHPRLPWEVICNVLGFLDVKGFLSLVLANKKHHRLFHEEFVRQHIPTKAGAERDWALHQMFFNALRYDSVPLLKQFLAIAYHDADNDRADVFNPYR